MGFRPFWKSVWPITKKGFRRARQESSYLRHFLRARKLVAGQEKPRLLSKIRTGPTAGLRNKQTRPTVEGSKCRQEKHTGGKKRSVSTGIGGHGEKKKRKRGAPRKNPSRLENTFQHTRLLSEKSVAGGRKKDRHARVSGNR